MATVAGSTTTYNHPDHLSTRAQTDGSGNVLGTSGTLPFGDSWYATGASTKWQFTSYERDSAVGENGLDYAQFRYYSSRAGRFVGVDPLAGRLGVPQSFNRYAYAANDPVNLLDPSGLASVCAWGVTSIVNDRFNAGPWTTTTYWGWGCGQADFWGVPGSMPNPLPNLFPEGPLAPDAGPLVFRLNMIQMLINRILDGKNPCADFLNDWTQNNWGESAGAVFRTVGYEVRDNSGPRGIFTTIGAMSSQNSAWAGGNSIAIYTRSSFTSDMVPAMGGQRPYRVQIGRFPGKTLGVQIAIILHELAHIVGAIPPDNTNADPNRTTEMANQEKMSRKCDDAIENVMHNIDPPP